MGMRRRTLDPERLDGFHDTVHRFFAAFGFRAFDRDEPLSPRRSCMPSIMGGVAEGRRLLLGRETHV